MGLACAPGAGTVVHAVASATPSHLLLVLAMSWWRALPGAVGPHLGAQSREPWSPHSAKHKVMKIVQFVTGASGGHPAQPGKWDRGESGDKKAAWDQLLEATGHRVSCSEHKMEKHFAGPAENSQRAQRHQTQL